MNIQLMKMCTIVVLIFLSLACKEENDQVENLGSLELQKSSGIEQDSGSLMKKPGSYNFNSPAEVWILDRKLKEISGLSYDELNNKLFAINDEKGHFYTLDLSTGDIVDDIRFSKNGDFEGLSFANGELYIAKHDGVLFSYNLASQEINKIKTKLSARNDVEGVAYESQSNSLLLACKGQGLGKSKFKNKKLVYQLSLDNLALYDEPFLVINDKDLVKKVKAIKNDLSKSAYKKYKHRVEDFSPSGIAIHPISKEIYLISARGSSLAIYSNEKELLELVFLEEKTLPQPEGICFDKEGALYLSTEGQGFSGKIFKFYITQ